MDEKVPLNLRKKLEVPPKSCHSGWGKHWQKKTLIRTQRTSVTGCVADTKRACLVANFTPFQKRTQRQNWRTVKWCTWNNYYKRDEYEGVNEEEKVNFIGETEVIVRDGL